MQAYTMSFSLLMVMTEYPIDKEIEEAIEFLVLAVHRSGKNSKPVILNSIRVGLHLHNLNYGKNTVIAALLHGVIEDTDVEIEEVKSKFGEEVKKTR